MEEHLKILIPYDFSLAAETALEYVRGFVEEMPSAEIILGYVKPEVESEVRRDLFDGAIEAFRNTRQNPVSWQVEEGSFTGGLKEIITRNKVNFIVMGTNSLHEGRLATNASQLALDVQCPVFVIPKGIREFKAERIGLLVGSDPIHNKKLLERLLLVARSFKAKVAVLTVKDIDDKYGYRPEDEANDTTIAYYLEDFYSHHAFIEGDDLGEAIFEYTTSHSIDLIAILPRNHAKNIEPSEGRLTRHLCEHSKTPLLVIDL